MSRPHDTPDDVKEQRDYEAELSAQLMGIVVKCTTDNHPGCLLHYQDGRVMRLIANTGFVGVAPLTTGTVH